MNNVSPCEDWTSLSQDQIDRIVRAAEVALKFDDLECARHSLAYTIRRVVRKNVGPKSDGPIITQILADFLRGRSGRSARITVAGAADDGLLEVCVDAARLADMLPDVTITIVDSCPAPLELNRLAAERLGANVVLRQATIPFEDSESADIVLAHSLLRHIPLSDHDDVVTAFANWLRPQGIAVVSHLINKGTFNRQAPSILLDFAARAPGVNARVRNILTRVLNEMGDRPPTSVPYWTSAEFLDLFKGSGLSLVRSEDMSATSSEGRDKHRCIAVLSRASEA